MQYLMWIAAALSTYRLTRLMTADRISERLRIEIDSRSPMLGYLITCDWCLSIWVAPIVATAVHQWGDTAPVQIGIAALAMSAVTGLLSLTERKLDA
jgi:hypothetical protein